MFEEDFDSDCGCRYCESVRRDQRLADLAARMTLREPEDFVVGVDPALLDDFSRSVVVTPEGTCGEPRVGWAEWARTFDGEDRFDFELDDFVDYPSPDETFLTYMQLYLTDYVMIDYEDRVFDDRGVELYEVECIVREAIGHSVALVRPVAGNMVVEKPIRYFDLPAVELDWSTATILPLTPFCIPTDVLLPTNDPDTIRGLSRRDPVVDDLNYSYVKQVRFYDDANSRPMPDETFLTYMRVLLTDYIELRRFENNMVALYDDHGCELFLADGYSEWFPGEPRMFPGQCGGDTIKVRPFGGDRYIERPLRRT